MMRKRKGTKNIHEVHVPLKMADVISLAFGCGGDKEDKRSSHAFDRRGEDRIQTKKKCFATFNITNNYNNSITLQ